MLKLLLALAAAALVIPLVWSLARVGAARLLRIRLTSVSLGFPASPGCALAGWTWRGVPWEMTLFPIGIYLTFDDASPAWRRLVVGFAGPLSALALGLGTLFGLFLTTAPEGAWSAVVVVAEDGPAAVGGVRNGDRVVSIDGIPTRSFDDLGDAVRARPGRSVPLVVERDGRQRELAVALGQREDDGALIGVLGVGVDRAAPQVPLRDPGGWAWDRTLTFVALAARFDFDARLANTRPTVQALGMPAPVPWELVPLLVGYWALLCAALSVLPLPPFALGEGLFALSSRHVGDAPRSVVRASVAALFGSLVILELGVWFAAL